MTLVWPSGIATATDCLWAIPPSAGDAGCPGQSYALLMTPVAQRQANSAASGAVPETVCQKLHAVFVSQAHAMRSCTMPAPPAHVACHASMRHGGGTQVRSVCATLQSDGGRLPLPGPPLGRCSTRYHFPRPLAPRRGVAPRFGGTCAGRSVAGPPTCV
eukprot:351327-Chlamydomonas_euryale.AAC.8